MLFRSLYILKLIAQLNRWWYVDVLDYFVVIVVYYTSILSSFFVNYLENKWRSHYLYLFLVFLCYAVVECANLNNNFLLTNFLIINFSFVINLLCVTFLLGHGNSGVIDVLKDYVFDSTVRNCTQFFVTTLFVKSWLDLLIFLIC